MLADGKILASDLAWTEGMANWGPALQVIPTPAQPPEPPAPAMEPLPPTRVMPAMRAPAAPQQAAPAAQPAEAQPAPASPFQAAPQPAQPAYQAAPAAQSAQPYAQPAPQATPQAAFSQPAHPFQPAPPPAAQSFTPAAQPYTPAPPAQPASAYTPQPVQQQAPYAPPPPAAPYQPYGAPPPAQPMGAQPMGYQQQAGQAFNPAFGAAAQGGVIPPGMHWFLLLVLGGLTFGIFTLYWAFKQAGFVQRIDPSNPAKKLYTILVLVLLAYVFVAVGAGVTGSQALLTIVGAAGSIVNIALVVLSLVAIFKMRSSLVNYYNTVEPIGLRLSGAMTLFFNIYYFQYHFHRIAQWKTTGLLTPQR